MDREIEEFTVVRDANFGARALFPCPFTHARSGAGGLEKDVVGCFPDRVVELPVEMRKERPARRQVANFLAGGESLGLSSHSSMAAH